MLCTSIRTLIQNLRIGKVCRVAEAVTVGFVAVAVGVDDAVGDSVAVAGSSVDVAVGSRVWVDVKVGVTVGGAENDVHANASRRISPMMI